MEPATHKTGTECVDSDLEGHEPSCQLLGQLDSYHPVTNQSNRTCQLPNHQTRERNRARATYLPPCYIIKSNLSAPEQPDAQTDPPPPPLTHLGPYEGVPAFLESDHAAIEQMLITEADSDCRRKGSIAMDMNQTAVTFVLRKIEKG